jgi:hypothetical protein
MLHITTQDGNTTFPNGDFLYCDEWVKEKFRALTENQLIKLVKNTDYNPISLRAFGKSPWDVLGNKDIFGPFGEKLLQAIFYGDFYTQPDSTPRTSMAMIPHIWLTKGGSVFLDLSNKLSEHHKTLFFDAETNRQVFQDSIDDEDPLSVEEIMALGSGIQRDFSPVDGSSSIVPVAMDTEEGDILIFLANCWHNK